MNWDCYVCRDRGVVRGEYDGDNYVMDFCPHCQIGQELAEEHAARDAEPVEEPVPLRRVA